MRPLFGNAKCPNCGREYDVAREKCPSCKEANRSLETPNRFATMMPIGTFREIALAALGTLGATIIATLIMVLVRSVAPLANPSLSDEESLLEFLNSGMALAIVNYSAYAVLLIAFIAIIYRDIARIFKSFLSKNTIYGVLCGFAILFFSMIVSYLVALMGFAGSDNQGGNDKMALAAPITSVLMIVFVIPFVEELTYRLGFFNLGTRIHPILGWVFSIAFFSFAHLQDPTKLSEWANLLVYLVGGIGLSVTYRFYGFSGSYIAHMTYNLAVTIINIAA